MTRIGGPLVLLDPRKLSQVDWVSKAFDLLSLRVITLPSSAAEHCSVTGVVVCTCYEVDTNSLFQHVEGPVGFCESCGSMDRSIV